MSGLEVFLDDTPGETRGVVMRDGLAHHLIIHRDDDEPRHRLGARVVGRVARVEAAFGAAFVDMGCGEPFGFLPLSGGAPVREGDRVQVEVTAERRDGKGPALRRLGAGEGDPRLISEGPGVVEILAELAPGVAPVEGAPAIEAVWAAEEEALEVRHLFNSVGVDLALERTRALVAVDIDHAGQAGRDPKQARARANREGLRQAARLIRLKSWGGLVAIDLVGTRVNPEHALTDVRAAFDQPHAAYGPVSRFGLAQLSLPWRRQPIEARLRGGEAVAVARSLRQALLTRTQAPRLVARCAPDLAAAVGPLAARLGPRAGTVVDPTFAAGRYEIKET
ncbi:RNA-binding protein [Brevundimonas sp. S30B]|uniref:ribonuclease E/G n=1 Tax=unclassified Brevundimonas TaxID=2622653 RepID=UPI0010727D18|nr:MULTISPECIES: ribonuclease E/G [unclassified Brevundimonas]QBX38132.1 RNA-binding protein [Brevundimonas sp. MF30-B]TFW01733.1 RNA-binding protein [Brevundimonas sp. S30B]